MSEAKFTPRPWTCEEHNDHGFNVIDGAGNGLMKCSFYTSAKRLEDDANMGLVLAAPEMYQVLLEIAVRLHMAKFDAWGPRIERILAKARGES